jgi:hypothetical protein
VPERPYRRRELHDHLVRPVGPCLERAGFDQSTPDGLRPAQLMCTRCGRVTARRDEHGEPWCGGEPVTPGRRTAEILPGSWSRPDGPMVRAA